MGHNCWQSWLVISEANIKRWCLPFFKSLDHGIVNSIGQHIGVINQRTINSNINHLLQFTGLGSKVTCRGNDRSCFWTTSPLLFTLKDFKQSYLYSSIALSIVCFCSSLRSSSVTPMTLSVSRSEVAMSILLMVSHWACQKMCWCKNRSANTKG